MPQILISRVGHRRNSIPSDYLVYFLWKSQLNCPIDQMFTRCYRNFDPSITLTISGTTPSTTPSESLTRAIWKFINTVGRSQAKTRTEFTTILSLNIFRYWLETLLIGAKILILYFKISENCLNQRFF